MTIPRDFDLSSCSETVQDYIIELVLEVKRLDEELAKQKADDKVCFNCDTEKAISWIRLCGICYGKLVKMKAVNKDMKFGEICSHCHQEKSLRNPDCYVCGCKNVENMKEGYATEE